MKKYNVIISFLAVIPFISMSACEDSVSLNSDFKTLCEASGGTLSGDTQCLCGGDECPSGVICEKYNSEGKNSYKCAGNGILPSIESEIVIICNNDESNHGRQTIYEIKNSNTDNKTEKNTNECANGYSCKEDKKSCGECINDDEKCEDDKIYKCINGSWGEGSACENESCCPNNNEQDTETEIDIECLNDESNHGKLTFYEIKNGDKDNKTEKYSNECANGYSCKDDESCGECINDDEKCEDDKIYKCINGSWGEGAACENESSCQSSTECGECLNGATKCTDGKYKPCVNGIWLDIEVPCDSGKCTDDGSECAQKTECEGDEKRCTEKEGKSILQTCVDNKWVDTECEQGCIAQNAECANCTDGDTKCEDGKGLSICIGGKWSETTQCTCKDDKSCTECEPDSKQCVDALLYRVCQQDGTWSENRNCINGEKCFQGECQATCTTGSKQCVNNEILECDSNNQWKEVKSCEYGCNPESTGIVGSSNVECNECETGTTECNDKTLKTCQNGKWQEEEDKCKYGCYNGECAKCDENEPPCTNDKNGNGQITTCDPAAGLTTVPCKNVSCSGNQCGECKNGNVTCKNDNKGIGHVKTCKEGKWVETKTCENASCNADNTSCGSCINDTTSCNNFLGTNNTISVKTTCENGTQTTTYCNYGEKNNDNKCNLCTPYFVHERTIKASSLNVRDKPDSKTGNKIGYYSKDDIVTVYARNGNWFLINFNGQAGWFFGGYANDDNKYYSIYSEPNTRNLKDNPNICADFLGVLDEVKEMWSYNNGKPITTYCEFENTCKKCTQFLTYDKKISKATDVYQNHDNNSFKFGTFTNATKTIYSKYKNTSQNTTPQKPPTEGPISEAHEYLLINFNNHPAWLQVSKEAAITP